MSIQRSWTLAGGDGYAPGLTPIHLVWGRHCPILEVVLRAEFLTGGFAAAKMPFSFVQLKDFFDFVG